MADAPMAFEITTDALLGGRVRLMQPKAGYRAAIDPVLLAAAVPAMAGEAVLELGCGAGAAMLCLAARVPGLRLVGVEIQEQMVDLARRNLALNGLEGVGEVMAGDLATPVEGLAGRRFDRVMANPPYWEGGRHTASPTPQKAISHGEGGADLADWIGAALRYLTARGTLTLILPAARLDQAMAQLAGRFGAVTVLPLWPRVGEEAKRVILHARRNVRGPARLLPGLVLHSTGQGYTAEAARILADAGALALE